MLVTFLDFEFGQIYGSWRRDFLVTQAAVLLYDTNNDTIKLAEIILDVDTNVVMRQRTKNAKGYKTLETVINYHTKKSQYFDNKLKIKKSKAKEIRQNWNKRYFKRLKQFLSNTLKNADTIYLFGGREDINILNRLHFSFDNIVDIQKILQNNYGTLYSLDKVIDTLYLTNFIYENNIISINYIYPLPKQSKKLFKYDRSNLSAHNASGDCVRLFLVYKELIN